MKVALVCYSDSIGGAARAAYRIHHALRSYGINSQMDVGTASAGDWTVSSLEGHWRNRLSKMRHPFVRLLTNVLQT